MNGIVDFIRARLDEDEQAARECGGVPWSAPIPRTVHVDAKAIADNKLALGKLGYVATVEHEHDRDHIARHDPARVLREVEAKRGIIEEHPIARNTVTAEGDFSNAPGCATCHESDGEVIAFGYCRTLRLLALPFADHPEFRKEWTVS